MTVVLVAGIDSSTQSCKVIVRDLDTGRTVRSGRAPHPDGTEVPPAAWLRALGEAVVAAGGLDDVAALSIAGQQHGMVTLDSQGHPVRDALLWNDNRSATSAQDLVAEVTADAYAERVGVVPVASFTASKLRWLRDHEPDNVARVAAICLPHDWLTWRVLGFGPVGESPRGPQLDALRTDPSDASGTAYWSAATGRYDTELFEVALGRRAGEVVLPQTVPPGAGAGTTVEARDLGGVPGANIPAGMIVAGGAGDNAAAALGLGADSGDVVVSIGTSGTVCVVTDAPLVDPSGTIACFADAAGNWLPLVCTLNAARVIDSVADLLGVDLEAFGDLALQAPPGAGGLVLHPYFEGERTPNLPTATAALSGMTLASTTRSNLARAAVEGILCGLADGLDTILGHGVSADRVLLIGGAAQNVAVRQVATTLFQAPVFAPEPAEYVALGAATQAEWSLTGQRPRRAVTSERVAGQGYRPAVRAAYTASAPWP